ncbi:hypothetical protein EJP02_430 [Escherichia phage EJP2]|nr:hypothetical protein EJP02_430 [Escherichia phage EJP2]
MSTFIVEYVLTGQSIWQVQMVKACNKEQAQSTLKKMISGVVTTKAYPA